MGTALDRVPEDIAVCGYSERIYVKRRVRQICCFLTNGVRISLTSNKYDFFAIILRILSILIAMNLATHTSAMVFYRKEHGLSQTEVARSMATTQSAVARLEKRLLTGADVTLSALQRYAGAIGLSIELTLKPVKQRYGIFPSAESAIAAAVHTSACEGRTVPANEVEDLWKMVRGEISRQDLIKKYVAEALAKQEARDRV